MKIKISLKFSKHFKKALKSTNHLLKRTPTKRSPMIIKFRLLIIKRSSFPNLAQNLSILN